MTLLIIHIIWGAVFILFLTNYDLIWEILFKKLPSIKRKKTVFVTLLIITISGNSFFAVTDYKTGNQTNKNLIDSMKSAIRKAGLKYDPTNNSIVNNNIQTVFYFGNAKDIHFNGVTVETSFNNGIPSRTKLFSKHLLSMLINKIDSISTNNHLKKVIIGFNNNLWQNISNQISDTLIKKGYVFLGHSTYTADGKSNGIDIETKPDYLIILLPDTLK